MSKNTHFIGQPLLGQILSFIDHAEVLRISKEHAGNTMSIILTAGIISLSCSMPPL